MDYLRPANERGVADFGWLNSRHSFSFGHYYDPKHMGFSVLRVINDDKVIGGAGFGTHGHQDMEIISYVTQGTIEHQDSMGNRFAVPAGDVQRISAGTGITHSEYNGSKSDPLAFLQIWIQPKQSGLTPSYEQARIVQVDELTPLVTPNGRENSLSMNQDASMYRLKLHPGESYQLKLDDRAGYLHTLKGKGSIENIGIGVGDGIGFQGKRTIVVQAHDDLEALWFDLPN